jgi:hypothetical protein
MFTLTQHAHQRITARLSPFTNPDEVVSRVTKVFADKPRKEKRNVLVKKVQYCEIPDPAVFPDGIARGDEIIAVVVGSDITTVMLRKSWTTGVEYTRTWR